MCRFISICILLTAMAARSLQAAAPMPQRFQPQNFESYRASSGFPGYGISDYGSNIDDYDYYTETLTDGGWGSDTDTSCPNTLIGRFEPIGNCCYHFSSEVVTWQDAWDACKLVNDVIHIPVSMAELGVSGCNDQALMNAIALKDKQWFWFGARSANNDKSFKWQAQRVINQVKTPTRVLSNSSKWWAKRSPTDYPLHLDNHNCVMAWPGHDPQDKTPKTYLGNDDCTDGVKYVCQTFPNRT